MRMLRILLGFAALTSKLFVCICLGYMWSKHKASPTLFSPWASPSGSNYLTGYRPTDVYHPLCLNLWLMQLGVWGQGPQAYTARIDLWDRGP